ncbi:GNAT family N-acetyltransferase [Rhizobium leguminosarum]|uniref:acyl-homoserine-lactone synthase n=1 Tax=Rhizobium leguminosarum TaxID=384 RepID=UPI001C9859EC|nr:acyl-homoserine-lactone synthase TraI [Rhizobium leguminosarum]MBY5760181.1 GNAT family N-acetyltransferase [Rhizobium leguminosarum]
MHVIAIRNPQGASEARILDAMHRLRARIFQGRLAWNVHCIDGREFDEFDGLSPTYIIALSGSETVVGCARLLPALGTTMLNAVFPELIRERHLPAHRAMIESSRFCVDTSTEEGKGQALHEATLSMFAGIIEWSIHNGYSEIATATDVRFERILGRAGWPMERLGDPVMINETRSVAGVLPADCASFQRLRPPSYTSDFIASCKQAA